MPLTLAIDQGTHATRAFAFDGDGRVRAERTCPIGLREEGERVEQDPDEILASLQKVVEEVLDDLDVRRAGVSAAGLATQRSSVVAWDRESGAPLGPVLSWLDRRVGPWLRRLEPQAEAIQQRTGLRLSPHYGGGKLRWLLRNVDAVRTAHRQGRLAFGPLAAFLAFHLLDGDPLVVDHVNASRTQLCDLGTRDWDPWLLDRFDVPPDALPRCVPVQHRFGRLRVADVPLTAMNGDQNAALFACGPPAAGVAVVNVGTGAFVLAPTGSEIRRDARLLTGLAASTDGEGSYVLEGTVNGAGAALEWAATAYGIEDLPGSLSAWLDAVPDPPVFVNTIGGLGSPWWTAGPAPRLLGDAGADACAVAVAESIVFLLRANLDALRERVAIERIRIGGGLAAIDGLCQRLADLACLPVARPEMAEATARGTAWLARATPSHVEPAGGSRFAPRPNPPLEARYARFLDALA